VEGGVVVVVRRPREKEIMSTAAESAELMDVNACLSLYTIRVLAGT